MVPAVLLVGCWLVVVACWLVVGLLLVGCLACCLLGCLCWLL